MRLRVLALVAVLALFAVVPVATTANASGDGSGTSTSTTSPDGSLSLPSSGPGEDENRIGGDLGAAKSEYVALQADLDRSTVEHAELSRVLIDAEARLVRSRLSHDEASREAYEAKSRLHDRAIAAYKQTNLQDGFAVFNAASLNDAATRMRYVGDVVESDRNVVRSASQTRDTEAERRVALEAEVSNVEAARARLVEARTSIEASLQLQTMLITDLERELAEAIAQRRLEDEKRLRALQVSLRTVSTQAYDFSVTAIVDPTNLACPVDGPVSFSNDWGAPRSSGGTHKGNDLFATYGTPLVAVNDGVVITAGDDGSISGIRVWISTPDGIDWFYAHMSRVDVTAGQSVVKGQQVGAVGNSGNARTTPPHVHFQIHPGGRAQPPINPYGTMIRVCG